LFVTFVDVLEVWRCTSFCVIGTAAYQQIRRLRSTVRAIVGGEHDARLSVGASAEGEEVRGDCARRAAAQYPYTEK
jgi:hypothetical protein